MLAGLSTAFGGSMNRTGPAALTLGALLLLASCSGEDADAEPRPRPTATSEATSASPTPTEPAPTMPAQARDLSSNESAAAFVDHYFDVFSYAARTRDTTELRQLTSPECTGCLEYVALFEDRGVPGLIWAVKDVTVTSDPADFGLRVKVEANEEDGPATYDLYIQVNKAQRLVTVLEEA